MSLSGRLFLTVALTAVAIYPVRAQDTHAYALISSDEKDVFFVDLKSVTKNSDIDSFWVLDVTDPTASKFSYQMFQYAISCTNWRLVTLYSASYGVDGTALNSGDPHDTTGAPIIPGSIGEATANYLCKGIDPHPDVITLPDTNSAVRAGHDVIAETKKYLATSKSDKPLPPKRTTTPVKHDGAI